MPKVLLEIAGVPLIERNIVILRDQLGITDIVVVVGYLADQIRASLGDGARLGVRLRYVDCPDPKVGLARGVLLAEPLLQRPFVTLLGDELYLGSNHRDLVEPEGSYFAVCGVRRTTDPHLIQKNYGVALDPSGQRIVDLEEKPAEVKSDLIGCGTWVLTPAMFGRIRNAQPNPKSGRVELIDVIAAAAREGEVVRPFFLEGDYLNVNSIEDYNYANYVARSRSFADYRVSVVIPAYNEEDSIGHVVADFAAAAHEVLVVDNSSKDRTAEVARARGARVETVSCTGYGDTIAWGLDHAIGDILVVVEADYSFRAKDLNKFLEYLKDADMVIGTRTTREMIEQGSNMGGLLRLGNIVVGKIIELLWWSQEPRFTDVGCSYRAIWRESWRAIRDRVRAVGPEFSPEMMIEVLRARRRVVEIPISYHPRLGGESKHSAGLRKVSKTALRMLRLIFAKRFGR
jgi:NDP-sugar pyrophosphorylase family protein